MTALYIQPWLWLAAIIYFIWCFFRGPQLITAWARSKNYDIVSIERRITDRGPFTYGTARSQEVYQVNIYDKLTKNRKLCWIRTGKLWAIGVKEPLEVNWI